MSTILKALRRLEQEKRRKDRPLREQVASAPGDEDGGERARRPWPVLLGGMGIGVAAGLAVLFLFLRDQPRDPSGIQASGVLDTQAPEPGKAIAPRERRGAAAAGPRAAEDRAAVRAERRRRRRGDPEPAAAAPVVSPGVVVVERDAPAPRIRAEGSPDPPTPGAGGAAPLPGSDRPFPTPAALPGPQVFPEETEALAAVPQEAAKASEDAGFRPTPSPSGNRQPAPAAGPAAPPLRPDTASRETLPSATQPSATALAPARARTPSESRAAEAPARSRARERPAAEAPARPPTRELPAGEESTAPPFPALRVESTLWHPVAERRMAVVEVPGEGARNVREGEQVEGAVVTLIEPSGVVFRHAGREVRRRVGGGS